MDDENEESMSGGVFELELEDGSGYPDTDTDSGDEFLDAQSLLSTGLDSAEMLSVSVTDAMIQKETAEAAASPVKTKTTPASFDIVKVIGQGGYGKVFLVRKNCGVDKGKICAMKVLKKATIITSSKDVTHTKAERNILSLVKHPYIVDLLYAFQTHGKLYLIMQYVGGGELFTYLDREGMFLEDAGRFYAAELIVAVEHLHSLGIIYRDLKPENIMLHADGHIVLTDFGLCKESVQAGKRTHTFCGTIEYMAPEILNREGHGMEADWWSLGALLFDMVTGSPPFVAHNRKKTMEKISKAQPRFPPFLTNEIKDLLRKLLCRGVDKRYGSGASGGCQKIKDHLWFRMIDWDHAANRGLTPPYTPDVAGDLDTSNFDRRFTEQPAMDSPTASLPSAHDGASGSNLFEGFSYVTPSVFDAINGLAPMNHHTPRRARGPSVSNDSSNPTEVDAGGSSDSSPLRSNLSADGRAMTHPTAAGGGGGQPELGSTSDAEEGFSSAPQSPIHPTKATKATDVDDVDDGPVNGDPAVDLGPYDSSLYGPDAGLAGGKGGNGHGSRGSHGSHGNGKSGNLPGSRPTAGSKPITIKGKAGRWN